MSGSLADALGSGRFVVTSELNPPKGTDLGAALKKAEALRGCVDAFNVTDSHTARMTMAPIGLARALLESGFEPIVQVTGRDRNRIAIQGDLLAAAQLGVRSVVFMSGDKPEQGDHPDAVGVFDLEAIGLLRAASALNGGHDLAGNELSGRPDLFCGAVANPGAADLPKELARLNDKVEAGARFVQTQPMFFAERFARFAEAAAPLGVPCLAGVLVLKSAKMAERINQVPGMEVPPERIRQLADSSDRKQTSVEIASGLVRGLREVAVGVHVMAIGWEDLIPAVIGAE